MCHGMTLASWRHSFDPKLTLAAAAERLGIVGKNPARTYQRYETGESAIDAIMAADIVERTCGAVSHHDLATIRAEWMRANMDNRRRSPASSEAVA